MTIIIPIRLPSAANLREHWAVKARRVKQHRTAARLLARDATPLPVSIRLVRIAPRELDTDNLASAFKGVRDGIADAYGVDDRDPRIVWSYAQERGRPKEYAVRVEILPSLHAT